MKIQAIKGLLSRNIEKVILGGAIALLLSYFIFGASSANGNADMRTLKERVDKIKERLSMQTANSDKGADFSPKTWNNIITPVEGNSWIGYIPPIVNRSAQPIDKGVDPLKMPAPLLKSVMANMGGIIIEWEDGSVPSGYQMLKPKSYAIMKKKVVDADYKEVGIVDAAIKKFTDTKVEPKTQYEYRILSITDNIGYVKTEGSDRSEPSKGIVVKSEGVFKISYKGVMGDTAVVTVEKFEVTDGSSYKGTFWHKRGEKIGDRKLINETAFGAKLPKQKEIDFSTGYVVKSFNEKEKVEVSYLECKSKELMNPLHQPVMEKVTIEVDDGFIYVDDEGKEQKIWGNGNEPKGPDKRCPDHMDPKPKVDPQKVDIPKSTPKKNNAKKGDKK